MVTKPSQPNIFLASRSARRVLAALADKWTVLVIYALLDETKRFSQLREQIEGISQKMLTQTLRKLEGYQLVVRTVYPVMPPMVEYTLTPLGKSLVEPLTSLSQWAEAYMRAIEASDERWGVPAQPAGDSEPNKGR